jgi:S-DNA-T family DNA segregation ATPase FtsK/SpoIIIE
MTNRDFQPTPILRAAVPPVLARGCVVTVVSGPDEGKRFVIDDVVTQRVLLGQSPVCGVVLTDRAVSRRHASLEADSAGVRLVDL